MGATGGGGMPAAGEFRYARLRALSNLTGNPAWASVAEIQLLTTGETPIARTNWTITADSEETVDESAPATAAIDGSASTFWHSAWVMSGVGDAPLPHHITIDMKAPQKVIGFTYLPRQDASENGQIAMYEFYLSNDAQNFGQPVETGSFPAGKTMIKVVF
jgi:galactose oxidase